MRPFSEIALEYCTWVEQPSSVPDLARWLPTILAELVHTAYSLPDNGLADAGAEKFDRRKYEEVRAGLPQLPIQYYREVFDPLDLDSSEEPVTGDLYDDIADIYGDLAEGSYLYRQGASGQALLFWGQSFRYHWGQHATGALHALFRTRQHRPT